MTFKSLTNVRNDFGKAPVERYHSDGNEYHHEHHGSYKGKGGGNSAALSALTLLAFLFLLNVMQQSLQDNNSTLVPTTTTLLLRDTELPIILDNEEEKNVETKDNFARIGSPYTSKAMVKDTRPKI